MAWIKNIYVKGWIKLLILPKHFTCEVHVLKYANLKLDKMCGFRFLIRIINPFDVCIVERISWKSCHLWGPSALQIKCIFAWNWKFLEQEVSIALAYNVTSKQYQVEEFQEKCDTLMCR